MFRLLRAKNIVDFVCMREKVDLVENKNGGHFLLRHHPFNRKRYHSPSNIEDVYKRMLKIEDGRQVEVVFYSKFCTEQ